MVSLRARSTDPRGFCCLLLMTFQKVEFFCQYAVNSALVVPHVSLGSSWASLILWNSSLPLRDMVHFLWPAWEHAETSGHTGVTTFQSQSFTCLAASQDGIRK